MVPLKDPYLGARTLRASERALSVCIGRINPKGSMYLYSRYLSLKGVPI